MNSEVILDRTLFYKRINKISDALDKPLLIMLGKRTDVEHYHLNSALFNYLLGFEFSETVIVIKNKPVIYTSAKKALIFEQLGDGIRIVRNTMREDPNSVNSFLSTLNEEYHIVDRNNIKGDFCNIFINNLRLKDCTEKIYRIFIEKEGVDVSYGYKAALICNHMIKKVIELCRDDEFSKNSLEHFMNERIAGIEPSLVNARDTVKYSPTGVNFAIRYNSSYVEIGRIFLTDATEEYALQTFMMNVVKKGIMSNDVLTQLEEYASENGIEKKIHLYTIGMQAEELSFETDFRLEENMFFVLRVGEYFANTFLLTKDDLQLITLRDTAEEYSVAKLKFRNKTTEAEVRTKIKEHQKELLDELTNEMQEKYKNNNLIENEKAVESKVAEYKNDAAVPRSKKVHCDFDNLFVIVPILSYSVPFHISNIKNVAVSSYNKLRINFKDSKEIRELSGQIIFNTQIKSLSITLNNADAVLSEINEMKKEYAKPKIEVKKQGELKERDRKIVLTDVLMKTDHKLASRKSTSVLELHENGFKYLDVHFLFSNIKSIFYQQGDFELISLIHFNFKEPILVNDKPTHNLQFHKKQGVNYHDTSRRENEHMAMLRQQEEEDELFRVNREFQGFVDKIEQETNFTPQMLQKGFVGVYFKESASISLTSNALVSVNETPFFVLYLDDIEIVNFERVTYATKTFDCVFIFKDKTKPVKTISSIETTKLSSLKTVLDSLNIVFMETKISINWPVLMQTIIADPLGFYNSGGWAELLVEDPVEESTDASDDESVISSDASSEEDSDLSDLSSDASSESIDTESNETSSFVDSDTEEYEQPKKRRGRR